MSTPTKPLAKMTAEEIVAQHFPGEGGKALLATGRSMARDLIADAIRDYQLELAGKKPAPKPLWIEYKMGPDGNVIKTESKEKH